MWEGSYKVEEDWKVKKYENVERRGKTQRMVSIFPVTYEARSSAERMRIGRKWYERLEKRERLCIGWEINWR